MTKQCYIVLSLVEYEGTSPIKVFMNKEKANGFAKLCEEYHIKKPNIDSGVDVDSLEFEEWSKRYDDWSNNHPAGVNGCYADKFLVCDIPLDEEFCIDEIEGITKIVDNLSSMLPSITVSRRQEIALHVFSAYVLGKGITHDEQFSENKKPKLVVVK
jgi:hypothetical protein